MYILDVVLCFWEENNIQFYQLTDTSRLLLSSERQNLEFSKPRRH